LTNRAFENKLFGTFTRLELKGTHGLKENFENQGRTCVVLHLITFLSGYFETAPSLLKKEFEQMKTSKRYGVAIALAAFICFCAFGAVKFIRQAEAHSKRRTISGIKQKIGPLSDHLADTRQLKKDGDAMTTEHRLVNLQDGGSLRTEGLEAALKADSVDIGGATPIGLASDDLNADGNPDLVCSYASAAGGFLIVHYGSERAFAPKDAADLENIKQNRFPSPFGSSVLIQLDKRPDNVFTGDFNHDSRTDILTATTGGNSLDVLLSDGDGGFTSEIVELPGALTAVTVGQWTLADGYADVAVGTSGGQILIFDEIKSDANQNPTVYRIPGVPDQITFGRLDDDISTDLVTVSDGRLYVQHGGAKASPEQISLPFQVKSLTIGDFIWDRDSKMEIAVADSDGNVKILSRGALDRQPLTSQELVGRRQLYADIRDGKLPASVLADSSAAGGDWQVAEEIATRTSSTNIGTQPLLMPVLESGQQSVDLLTVDPLNRRIDVSYRTDGLKPQQELIEREIAQFSAEGEPVAVLPMRLNIHSNPSMVILNKGSLEPSLMFFVPEATITVTSTADVLDANAGNCSTMTIASLPGPNGVTSLREAVCAANNTAGADTISLPAGTFQLTRTGDDNTASNGDLDINSDITVTGAGQASTFIQGSSSATFTGNMGDKIFGINQDGTFTTLNVTISNLTVRFTRNDIVINSGFTQTGGATDIFLTGTGAMPGPTTNLTNVTYDSNASAHSYGGALNVDSGSLVAPTTNVFRGTVNITGSTFSNNKTLETSVTTNQPHGGAINLFSDIDNVTISSSSITANQTAALQSANAGGINVRHSFGGTVTINSNTNIRITSPVRTAAE
jgi:hypothetical protein